MAIITGLAFIALNVPQMHHARFAILAALLAGALFLWGCDRGYHASLVFHNGLVEPPPSADLRHPEGAEVFAALLRSEKFWARYVDSYFADHQEATRVRQGLTVSHRDGLVANAYRTMEIELMLRYGGESAFDTIHKALRAYGAPVLEIKKPTG